MALADPDVRNHKPRDILLPMNPPVALWKLVLIGGALAVLLAMSAINSGAQTPPKTGGPTKTGSPTPVPDASKSERPSGPPAGAIRAVYWKDGDQTKIGTEVGKGDANQLIERFVFDKKSLTAAPVANANSSGMKIGDNPIPLVMTGFNFAAGGGSASARYSNVFLDLHALADITTDATKKYVGIAAEEDSDGSSIGEIYLRYEVSSGLFVSPDYVVFPEGRSTVAAGGPFARVEFLWARDAKKTGALLVVSRNGKELARTKPGATSLPLVKLTSVKNKEDAVSYKVLDNTGKTVYSGLIGFPVLGAVPDIVEYTVVVTDAPSNK